MATNKYLGLSADGSELIEFKSKMARHVGDDVSAAVKATVRATLGVPASAEGLTPSQNLNDVANKQTSRDNLELYSQSEINDRQLSKAPTNGLSFDGVNDKLDCAQNAATDFGTGDFSWAGIIIVPSSVTAGTLCGTRIGAVGWATAVQATGELTAVIEDSGGNTTSTTDGGDLRGRIAHVAVVWDRSGNMTRYIDGVATGSATDISSRSGTVDNSQGFHLGHRNSDSYLEVTVLSSLLYDKALSAAEIAELARNGNRPEPGDANLAHSLQERNLESDSWVDESSNEIDGTITGATRLFEPLAQASGTFTPVLQFGGGTTGITYGTQSGVWNKINEKLVQFTLRITLTSKGTDTGNAEIHGMPFNFANLAMNTAVSLAATGSSMANLTSIPTAKGRINTDELVLVDHGASGETNLNETNFTNTTTFTVHGVYEIA